jgi:hypothetical protein
MPQSYSESNELLIEISPTMPGTPNFQSVDELFESLKAITLGKWVDGRYAMAQFVVKTEEGWRAITPRPRSGGDRELVRQAMVRTLSSLEVSIYGFSLEVWT